MNCDLARAALHPYLDGEIDACERTRLEAHLAACPCCAAALADLRSLGQAVRASVHRHRAPASLAARIGAALPSGATEPAPSLPVPSPLASSPRWRRRFVRRWLPLAASLLLMAVVSSGITLSFAERGAEGRADDEVIAAHVRSLMVDHLTDVSSSNHHVVRPWFSGRIDVAPPVRDLAVDGFPLVGGRLDYLGGRASAALVYRYGPHVINVFIRPAADGTTEPEFRSRQGYLIAEWSAGELAYTAVSDVGRDEMERLVRLLTVTPPPSPPGPGG